MGISKNLKERLFALVEEHKWKPTDKLIQELLTLATTHGVAGEAKKSTIINRMSFFKKYLRETERFDEDFLYQIKAPTEMIDAYNEEQKESLAKRKTFKVKKNLVDKLLALKDKTTLVHRLIYVLFATGRRINEILNPEFKISKRVNKNQIVFSHLSKKARKRKEYIHVIPEAEAKDIINRIKFIREERKKMMYDIPELTKIVDKGLKKIDSDLNPHSLRGIYALYNWVKVDKRETHKQGYIKEILNHDGYDTATSYSHYIVDDNLICDDDDDERSSGKTDKKKES